MALIRLSKQSRVRLLTVYCCHDRDQLDCRYILRSENHASDGKQVLRHHDFWLCDESAMVKVFWCWPLERRWGPALAFGQRWRTSQGGNRGNLAQCFYGESRSSRLGSGHRDRDDVRLSWHTTRSVFETLTPIWSSVGSGCSICPDIMIFDTSALVTS